MQDGVWEDEQEAEETGREQPVRQEQKLETSESWKSRFKEAGGGVGRKSTRQMLQ